MTDSEANAEVQKSAQLRDTPAPAYTIPDAIGDALWLARTPDGILDPEKARRCIVTLLAALQANPAVFKGARLGIPVFGILAYDKAGHAAITTWITEAKFHGCREEKLGDARRILARWAGRADLTWPT